MRKRVILALMLIVAMFVTSGCKLIVKDPEVDRQTTIIEVAGKVFTKGEVVEQVNYTLDYQEYIYAMMYGYAFDKTNSAIIEQTRLDVVNALIRETLIEQKALEMGMDIPTEEELAEMQINVDETYNSYMESVKAAYFAETELTESELDEAIVAKIEELGYSSKEALLDNEKAVKSQEKLKAEIVKDVQVTDEEIAEQYASGVEASKASYESSLPSYGSAVRNGSTLYYTPAGYRYVKHILRQISEDDATAISDLESKISTAQTRIADADTSLASLNEDAEQDTEEEAKNRVQWQADKAAAETELAEAQAALETAKETAYANLQPVVDEIKQKIAEGTDFDALVEEYGEDDGMKTSPTKETGYLVCEGDTQWVAEFADAAMALSAVGDISPEVRTTYGIHILKYESELAEGEVPIDEVKDTLTQEILTQKQDELFESTADQWVAEANAKVYMNRLD